MTTTPHPTPEERYEAALDRMESEEVFLRDAMIAAIREAEAAAEARGFERAARYLERQPSFGDGAWAARHVRNCAHTDKESSDD